MEMWDCNLNINDLPNDELKTVADICGIESAVKLMTDMPGIMINIPKTGLNKCRNKYILKAYDGSKQSRMALAFKFGLSEGYILQLVCRNRKRSNPNDNPNLN